MKNLKKILIGLLVLMLLVSSAVVLVVTAEEDAVKYTGSLSKAQSLFADAPTFDDPLGEDSIRKTKLADLYSYLSANPIDPTTEGYAEFKAELDVYALRVSNHFYAFFVKELNDSASTLAKRQAALGEVVYCFTTFDLNPDTPDPDGAESVYFAYDELFAALETDNFNMMKGFYDAAVENLKVDEAAEKKADYVSAMTNLSTLYSHVAKYPLLDGEKMDFAKFYADYNELSIVISESVIAHLATVKGEGETPPAEYYTEISKLLPPLKTHISTNCKVDFAAFDEEKAADLQARFDKFDPQIQGFELGNIRTFFNEYKEYKPGDEVQYPELAKAAKFAKVTQALAAASISKDNEAYAEYLQLVADIAKEEAALAAVKEARRSALESTTPLYAYEMTDNLSYRDFESGQTMGNPNASAVSYSQRATVLDAEGNVANTYWEYISHAGMGNTTHSYATLTQTNVTNGFVYSFDMMIEGIDGKNYTKATYTNEWQNSSGTRLVNYGGNIFVVAYDKATDSVTIANAKNAGITTAVTVKNIATPGQWFNLMFTYDYNTHYGKLYIDYEYMFDIYIEGWVEGATRTVFRATHNTAGQRTCYDNVIYYEGTEYRDINRFNTENKTINEKTDLFTYCVGQFTNDSVDSKSAKFAYTQASLLVEEIRAHAESGEMTDDARAALKEKITAFDDYNYEDKILVGVREQNLREVLARVEAIEALPVRSDYVSKINAAITDLDKFINENSDFIDKTNKEFNEALKKVDAVKQNLTKLDDVKALAKALKLFTRTTSLASMTKRYTEAEAVYKNAKYDNEKYREPFENDPIFLEFEALINGSLTSEDPGYVTWHEYYLSIPAKLAKQEKVENSARIITCINLLQKLEGYENTEEYWASHNDEVDFYITIIRNIVLAENYDPAYTGIDQALAQYELVDAYFNKILQQKHISIIGEQLDNFADSEYIEKVGICTYLDRYFENNPDIDKSSPEIQEFMYRLERYKAELESQQKDYINRLEENTKQFISIVGSMSVYSTYAELKPLYDNALSYYYLMNVDSAEAQASIALFEAYGDALETVEVNCALFMSASKNLNAALGLGVTYEYSILSDLSKYYPYVDSTYSEEVKNLMQRYEGLVATYNNAVISTNNVADMASDVTSALRSNQISVTVLAVVSQLYKNIGR